MPLADLVGQRRAHLALAGAALVLLAAWMGAAAWTKPVAHHETRTTPTWAESSSFTYAVPVVRNSTHWPIGTLLPMGQPAYFRTISDSIQVQHTWTPVLPGDARGVAAGSMVVRIEARDPAGRAYWTIEHPLASGSTETIADGLALAGVVDLDALHAEMVRLNQEAPATDGVFNWTVRSSVAYAFEHGGRRESGESIDVLPITAFEPRYSLPDADALSWERPHAQVESVTTHAPAAMGGVLRSVPTVGAALLGIVLLAVGAIGLLRGARNEGFDREYKRHKEWISVAEAVPEAARDPYGMVDVATLEDLVQLAADARTRVMLDARTREFFALLPGVTYRYARHATTPDG